jgi:hypothetical protein
MLSIMAELHFEGVRVVSVADGLDSDDEETTLGIQIRGIFNELQLRDLRKKTLRGQVGQKEPAFAKASACQAELGLKGVSWQMPCLRRSSGIFQTSVPASDL